MSALPSEFYAQWRAKVRPGWAFAEATATPPERWLQQIWRHQRLRRDRLVLPDGRPVRVLHPGFWNRGPGPDFRDAVIQFGVEAPKRGDVEVDLVPGGWQGHHHAGNPAYGNVILHAVWEATPHDATPPVLPLQPFLDAPLGELVPWFDEEAPGTVPAAVLGRCCAPLREVSGEALTALLNQAAAIRLRRKTSEFTIRARHAGWEQALWEGLFGALGYRHNVWPLRRLAELVGQQPRPSGRGPESAGLAWEARLLGLAGLLPAELPRSEPAAHVRQLWDHWWRERDSWAGHILPPLVWRLAGIRPANHPHRRLALAARWIADGTLPVRLERWLAARPDESSAAAAALAIELVPRAEPDDFWERHWTLRSAPLTRPQPLLGASRVTDLAVNVILPWLLARAEAGSDSALVAAIQRCWFAWPAGEDNAVLKHARDRLFAGPTRRLPRTAAAQQGLLQIARDFCDPAGPLCSECRFPQLVRALPDPGAASYPISPKHATA